MVEQARLQIRTNSFNTCPVCGASKIQHILHVHQIPVLANVLWEKREDAVSAPRGNVQLSFCEICGHAFNQAFDQTLLEYDVQYENSLHFSPLFQKYADTLAQYLIAKYDLYGKKIIEIGSGKGDFLHKLCEYGNNTGTGFDPSYNPDPYAGHPALTFIKDIYSERYASFQADLVLFRHVLEHIYLPAEFIQSLRLTIGTRAQTVVFCEVPNFVYILRDTAVWDIIYEHVSYFSPYSLAVLFSRFDFAILKLADAFGSQFLSIEAIARETGHPSPNIPDTLPVAALADQVAGFATRSQEKISRWNDQIDSLRRKGKRAILWGAGSKGISFLNMLNVGDVIEYIVDVNPRKHGKYVTGTGQQIIPPEFLTDYRPDTIIVMNPIYLEEIQGMTAQHGLRVDFLTAS